MNLGPEDHSLQFPNEHPKKLVKIKCSNCGHVGDPVKWRGRIVLGILFMLFFLIPGFVFLWSTNPYVCESCGKRDSLTKILNNDEEIPLGGGTKARPVGIFILLLFLFLVGLVFGLGDRAAVEKGNEALEMAEQGDFLGAGDLSEEAAKQAIVPENQLELYKNAGFLYATDLQVEKALENFNNALDLTEDGSFNFYLIRGEISSLEEKPEMALENYLKAYDLAPDDFQINNALGFFYMDSEGMHPSFADYGMAVEYLERALELEKSFIIESNLVIAYVLAEDYDKALTLLAGIEPDAYVYFWTGVAYFGKGDLVNGESYLQKAFEMDPELEAQFLEYAEGENV